MPDPMISDRGPITDDPSDNTTLVDVLASYAEAGFDANHGVTDDGDFRCGSCHDTSPTPSVEMVSMRRLEGASNPEEMMSVVAARCPRCGAAGVVVAHYGPAGTIADAEFLRAVEDHRFDDDEIPGAAAPDENATEGPGTAARDAAAGG